VKVWLSKYALESTVKMQEVKKRKKIDDESQRRRIEFRNQLYFEIFSLEHFKPSDEEYVTWNKVLCQRWNLTSGKKILRFVATSHFSMHSLQWWIKAKPRSYGYGFESHLMLAVGGVKAMPRDCWYLLESVLKVETRWEIVPKSEMYYKVC